MTRAATVGLALVAVAGCAAGAGGGDDAGREDARVAYDGEASAAPPPADVAPCQGAGECPPAPTAVAHRAWHDRITESPTIEWMSAGGATAGFEVSVGSAPGATDAARWTAVPPGATRFTFRALWLREGERYFANVRAVSAQGVRSPTASSAGWRVDVTGPAGAIEVDDRRGARGELRWRAAPTDALSGFAGYRVAVGTAPGQADVVPWREVGAVTSVTLDPLPMAMTGRRYYASVRAVDAAGNASSAASSAGWIACPPGFAFVPGNAASGIATGAFCVSRFEMKIRGDDDGAQPYASVSARAAESRAAGTPWIVPSAGAAAIECGELGQGYALLGNPQWQTLARDIEATAENWSGGAVGAGFINRGHSDGAPASALAAGHTDADPCAGTGQPACATRTSRDYEQKRTHTLSTGEVVWDLAGNAWEWVGSAPPGPDGLWMELDGAPFTSGEGWEEQRAWFAPAGRFNSAHGVGRIYGGSSLIARGGGAVPMGVGVAGSRGVLDAGVFATNHNFQAGAAAFRCVFAP